MVVGNGPLHMQPGFCKPGDKAPSDPSGPLPKYQVTHDCPPVVQYISI